MTRKVLLTIAIGLLVAYLFFRNTFNSVVASVRSIGAKAIPHPAVAASAPAQFSQSDAAVNAAITVGKNAANQLIDSLFNGGSVTYDPLGNPSTDPASSSVDVSTLI